MSLTPEKKQQIVMLLGRGFRAVEIARLLDMSDHGLRYYLKQFADEDCPIYCMLCGKHLGHEGLTRKYCSDCTTKGHHLRADTI